MNEFKFISFCIIIILDQGKNNEIDKYFTKFNILVTLFWIVYSLGYLRLPYIFLENKMSNIPLAERKESMA